MKRLWWAAASVWLSCSNGELDGGFVSEPFQLRSTRLWSNPGQLMIMANDRVTACEERVRSGQTVELTINYARDRDLPDVGRYPLHLVSEAAALPNALAQAVVTDDQCLGRELLMATGEVELLGITRHSRTGEIEAALRIDLHFGDRVLAGTLTADQCTPRTVSYCDLR